MKKNNSAMPIKYKLLRFIGFSSLLWPLVANIIPFSNTVVLSSSIPIAMGWMYLVSIILFWHNIPRSSLAHFEFYIALSAMIFPLIFTESDFFRSAKTFLSPALFFIIIYIICFSRVKTSSNDWIVKISLSVFNLALWVSLFGLFEMTMRHFIPPIGSFWYGLLENKGFSGVEYIKYGYMNYGFIFEGQRPLGLFGDMHTAPLVGAICAVYFSSTGERWRFWLAIAAIVLTFRWTYYSIIPILIFLDSRYSRNPIIAIFVILLSIAPIAFTLSDIENDMSGSVIIEHLYNITDLLTLPWLELFFGIGYTGQLETKLGYSEIFIFKYILFFGMLGFIYFTFTILTPIYIYINSKRNKKRHCHTNFTGWVINYRAYIVLALIPIIGTIHYNAFFTPSIAFLYSLLLVLGIKCYRSKS